MTSFESGHVKRLGGHVNLRDNVSGELSPGGMVIGTRNPTLKLILEQSFAKQIN